MTTALRVAVCAATLMSCGAILACILFAPMIFSEVNDIWSELDREMLEFRVSVVVS